MRLSIRQYAEALLSLEQEIGTGSAEKVGKSFLERLSRTRETGKLSRIVREAEQLVREREKSVEVTITTAHTADTKTKALLIRQAENIFPGKKIEASFMTDTDLIGGMKIQSGEVLYDASVRQELSELKKTLC